MRAPRIGQPPFSWMARPASPPEGCAVQAYSPLLAGHVTASPDPGNVKAPPRCLGEVFSRLTFSDEEKVRIGALVASNGIAAHIVKRYVTHTEEYKNGFRKHEKIPGFRPATPAFDQQAIPLILRIMRDSHHPRYRVCWDQLYRASATDYIQKELPNLDRLLSEVSAPPGVTDSAELLRAVCSNALDFGVSQDDVRKFYEAWGTSRIENFEELLGLCLTRDEVSAQKRTLAKLVADLETLKEAVHESSSQAASQAEEIADDRRRVEEDRDLLRKSAEALQSLSRKVSDLLSRAHESDSRLKGLEDRLSQIAKTLRGEPVSAEALKDELRKAANETKSAISSAVGAIGTGLKKSWTDDVAAATRELETKISAVSADISGQRQRVESRLSGSPGGRRFAWAPADRIISDSGELRRAMAAAFKARGVAPAAATRIHAAMAAGLIPVVVGPTALLALDAFSRVACAGRATTVHVAPSLLEPSELFGRLEPARGDFVPNAAGLIDILHTAAESRGAALVTLEGINRGPTESYLLPLLQMRARSGRIPLFHPDTPVSPSSLAEAVVVWPPNVWLAATAVDGPTSLPISRDVLAYSVVIEVDACQPVSDGTRDSASELALDGELIRPMAPPTQIVDDLVEAFPDARGYRSSFDRFGAMLARFESDEGRLRTALVESVLLPLLVTLDAEDERAEAFQALGKHLGADESTRLAVVGRRLRRRIA